MKLWLLRHGEAEPHRARDDAQRALTARGEQEVRDSAHQLLNQPLDCILVSPYVRAQQSAQQLCTVLKYAGPLETVDWTLPDSDPKEALCQLASRPKHEQNVLLVTHQNFVGSLAGWLVEGYAGAHLPFSTGALACLEGPIPAAGSMELKSFHHPKI